MQPFIKSIISVVTLTVSLFPVRSFGMGNNHESSTDSYAFLNGDTLSIGNSLIERKMLLSEGSPATISLTDKSVGNEILSKGDIADFTANRQKPSGLSVSFDKVDATAVTPQQIRAIVSYNLGTLEVKRIYSVTDNCPAIKCRTMLRGRLDGTKNESDREAVRADKVKENSTGNQAADRTNIESVSDMSVKNPVVGVLDRVRFVDGQHWHIRTVEFHDVTDWNNNLVQENQGIVYRRSDHRGNLMILSNGLTPEGTGLFMLKEAPCSDVQLHYGKGDFVTDFGNIALTGLGVSDEDLNSGDWTEAYTSVIGIWTGNEREALQALRLYQKSKRLHQIGRDEMVMMNTWGDRSQDSKVNESFCLAELEKAVRLGITHFQIDDGWQQGKSPNSALAKGSFDNIWETDSYWAPDKTKYPNGLAPVVDRAKELGIQLGLWFNPSVKEDFCHWTQDASTIINLWRTYGITVYKIDGVQLPTKLAETNFRNFLDSVSIATDNQVVFNLDVTAGRRGGYNMLNEYGNIFLENRYTDWGNYYPYMTLRNLWQLSRYVAPETLQVEFLNNWRNADKYPKGDIYSPENYSFEYLFATTMAGQPLAWMEASNLPDEAFEISKTIQEYREIQHDFHQGIILPIGKEPSGHNWTGFQSIVSPSEGYLLIFRENTKTDTASLQTWLDPDIDIRCVPVISGHGSVTQLHTGNDGKIQVTLPVPNDFVLFKYTKLDK